MGYVICKDCGDYHELQSGKFPTNLGQCQCGGELQYKKHLNDEDDGFVANEEKKSGIKLLNSKMIKPLGLSLLFIFGLLLKFHALNFILYYFMRSNFNLSSSPAYMLILAVLGFALAYLGRFIR